MKAKVAFAYHANTFDHAICTTRSRDCLLKNSDFGHQVYAKGTSSDDMCFQRRKNDDEKVMARHALRMRLNV